MAAVHDWYTKQLKDYYLARLRGDIEDTDPPSEKEFGGAACLEAAALPEAVRPAYDFYKKHFEEADIGWARALKVPADGIATYAIRVHTDGDDGYLEVYDEQGGILAAGRTYLEIVAWGTADWLRAQAKQPGSLPPELQDAHRQTVYQQPTANQSEPTPAPSAALVPRVPIEVVYNDGSVRKLGWLDLTLLIVTNFGGLNVFVSHIRKIEFGTLRSALETGQVADALVALIDEDAMWRTESEAFLLQNKRKSYRALTLVAEHGSGEIQRRAAELAQQIKNSLPPKLLELRKKDVIYTFDSKYTGQIEPRFLKVVDASGAEIDVETSSLFCLTVLTPDVSPEDAPIRPDPGGGLDWLGLEFGKKLSFQVTGNAGGLVCGSGPYPLNSWLAATAVHAGQLQLNEVGIVTVEITVSPPSFQGSTQNGITSMDWNRNQYGAYQFVGQAVKLGWVSAEPPPPISPPPAESGASEEEIAFAPNLMPQPHGTKLSFPLTGRPSGGVYGTNVYTLDSDAGAAAVHAGILQVGETKTVTVEILEAPPEFSGSLQKRHRERLVGRISARSIPVRHARKAGG